MSAELAPKWCSVFVDAKLTASAVCPDCGVCYGDQLMGEINECIQVSYYSVAHIPPAITLTCDNPECKSCDKDFSVKLEALISLG